MKSKYCVLLFVLGCLGLLFASKVVAQSQPAGQTEQRDPEFEKEIYDRLAAINPEAVPLFQSATAAMDAGDLETAEVHFEQVLELAPDFPDALRRLSYVVAESGDPHRAVTLARQALDIDESATNRAGLAKAYLMTGTPTNEQLALASALKAAEEAPDDHYVMVVLLMSGLATENVEAIDKASRQLIRLLPEDPLGYFFQGLVMAETGDWTQAETLLAQAQALGWPAEEVQAVLASRPFPWVQVVGAAVFLWLMVMAVLFLLGAVFSRLTLRTVKQTQAHYTFEATTHERRLRALYRLVITLTAIYFYLSIPFLIILVLALAGGIFYLFLVVGQIPVRLAIFLVLAVLYTLYALVRSIFTRVKESDPGRPLSAQEAPELWATTREVAERIGTRPVDVIYLTPGTEIAVTEMGGAWKKWRGQGQRCLIIGLGILEGMSVGQFKSILAHEYGHFSNRDTAGGSLAWQTQLSMKQLAYRLAASGQARWYNPAWLFVNGYYRVFLRVTLGASRLQEILADRYAAAAYGVQTFIAGLAHVVRRSVIFDMQARQEVNLAIQQKRYLYNLYTLAPDSEQKEGAFAQQVAEAMNRETSDYDSHPAMKDRIAFVQMVQGAAETHDNRPATGLFAQLEALQNEMTAVVQKNIQPARAAYETNHSRPR